MRSQLTGVLGTANRRKSTVPSPILYHTVVTKGTDDDRAIFEDPHKLVLIQSRAEIDFSTVDEYTQMMLDGIVFDPVEGVQDEQGAIYIWDGYHRGEAAKKAEMTLRVSLRPGSKIEAEWLALTANQKHELRRSRADKQRVVRQALLHLYAVNLSNSEIGRHCGISDKTVAKIRQEMEVSSEFPKIDKRIVTRNGVSYEQDAAYQPDKKALVRLRYAKITEP